MCENEYRNKLNILFVFEKKAAIVVVRYLHVEIEQDYRKLFESELKSTQLFSVTFCYFRV